jgi:hypothetical protein
MRTFLLMLGSAFGGVVVFVAAVYGYFYWQYSRVPGGTVHFPPRSEKTVDVAPPLVEQERFYGTHGSYAGEFSPAARQTVLAAGAGKVVGSITSNGKPLQGLRLRLALNGAVMSQWATTGADGRYEVALPYGKYRIDGYELDSSSAQAVLAGKTDGPRQGFYQPELTVVEGKPGQGLDFAYVDPVKKLGPSGDIKLGQPVIVSWQPYPGAAAYRLQLVEQSDPRDYESQRQLFEWRERPTVSGTSADLADYKVALKKSHYYRIEIEALDERKRALSQSPRHFGRADFRVVE